MPVCDVDDYVGAAVRSILDQTWRNLELIVVDDSSRDQTPLRVRAAAEGDGRVRLLATDRRSGPYRARNLALMEARGELVCFADGDDWSHPERIARQAAFMAGAGLAAASARHVRVDEAGRPYARQLTPLVRWCPSSLMFRREPVLARAGHFDEARTGADSEYWARLGLAFGARRVRTARDLLVVAAQRSTSLTGSAETGYAGGWSSARLRYWEAWNFWHARCRAAGRSPVWRSGDRRPFPVSAELSTT
nr:glycosyltransferase family A protein [Caulobacter sp. 17J80-11]